jgi:hypothetical protein
MTRNIKLFCAITVLLIIAAIFGRHTSNWAYLGIALPLLWAGLLIGKMD